MKKLTNEQLEQLNEVYTDTFGTNDVIEFNEENNVYSCFSFMTGMIIEDEVSKETNDGEWWISFNEDVPTSTLLNICNLIVPALEEMLDVLIHIISCHAPIYNKKNEFKELVYEESYTKTIKKNK